MKKIYNPLQKLTINSNKIRENKGKDEGNLGPKKN